MRVDGMTGGVVGRRWGSLAGGLLGLAACLSFIGCQNFFQCSKASCTDSSSTSSGSTTNNTGDYAYVSNSVGTSGQTYLSAYNLASGTLATVSGSPFNLGYVPVAMKVSPNNSFLYVGAGTGGIYLYTIGSAGALTLVGNGPQITTSSGSLSSLDISPDGYWLFVMDQTGFLLSEYALNTSTGTLMGPTTFPVQGTSGCAPTAAGATSVVSQTCTVRVAPTGNYVGLALGAAGTEIFPYSSSGGITSASYVSIATPSADFSLAFDSNNYLYIARTAEVSTYGNVGSSPVNEGNIAPTSALTPRSVTLSTNGSYLYTANVGSSTISGFGLSGVAVLNVLSGSAYTGPPGVSALGVDNSGNYLLAVGYSGSNGVQLFKPASGVLGTAVASAASGTTTTYPALVALTH